MTIEFESNRFRKECNNHSLLVRRHGDVRAKKIRQRLDDLRAAASLEDMRRLPGRCHELLGNRSGELALDLGHLYRLVFRPANDPPLKADGGLDWTRVEAVVILAMEDYHG